MPHSFSIQAPTSRVVRGSVSASQAFSLSCCSRLKQHALRSRSWPAPRYPPPDIGYARCGWCPRPAKGFGDGRVTHAVVEQHQCVGTPGKAIGDRPVSSQFGQVLPRFAVQEARLDHAVRQNPTQAAWQGESSDSQRVGVYKPQRGSNLSIVQQGLPFWTTESDRHLERLWDELCDNPARQLRQPALLEQRPIAYLRLTQCTQPGPLYGG